MKGKREQPPVQSLDHSCTAPTLCFFFLSGAVRMNGKRLSRLSLRSDSWVINDWPYHQETINEQVVTGQSYDSEKSHAVHAFTVPCIFLLFTGWPLIPFPVFWDYGHPWIRKKIGTVITVHSPPDTHVVYPPTCHRECIRRYLLWAG